MVFMLKSNNLCKIYKKNVLNNVLISKVPPLAFMSNKDSSDTLPLPNFQRSSKSKLTDDLLRDFCVPTSRTCESILAGNPQSVDRRDLIRYDIMKKWEQKIKVNPKNNSTILVGLTMFGEMDKN